MYVWGRIGKSWIPTEIDLQTSDQLSKTADWSVFVVLHLCNDCRSDFVLPLAIYLCIWWCGKCKRSPQKAQQQKNVNDWFKRLKSATKSVSANGTTIYISVHRWSKYDKVPCLDMKNHQYNSNTVMMNNNNLDTLLIIPSCWGIKLLHYSLDPRWQQGTQDTEYDQTCYLYLYFSRQGDLNDKGTYHIWPNLIMVYFLF